MDAFKASLEVMGKAPVSAVAPVLAIVSSVDKPAPLLTAEELAAAKALNIAPEKYAAHRDNYKRGFAVAEEK
jgi:phage I-like protein